MRSSAKRTKETAGRIVELQGLLRAAGLRSTAPRVAVLRYLFGSGVPASHGELYEALRGEGFDRATLYRNLIDLSDAGLVTRIDVGDHVWRFEVKRRAGDHVTEHPHFVCSDCGAVSCLTDAAVRIVGGAGAPKSISTRNVSIQITAVCDACA
jgi:Fur family ferric uptake transcriptional regulator